MRFSRKTLSILSIIMILSMVISGISVFADSKSSVTGGLGGTYKGSGAGDNNCKWDYSSNRSQFLRISLYRAPRGEDTDNLDTPPDIDWSSEKVIQVGQTFDLTSSVPNGGVVVNHSYFTDAREYNKGGYSIKIKGDSNYYATKRVYSIGARDIYDWCDFPKPVPNPFDIESTKLPSDYVKNYFSVENRGGLNEILYILKHMAGVSNETDENTYGFDDMNVDWVDGGYWIEDSGEKIRQAYLLTIEPGVYATVNGKLSAYTLRDAIAWRIPRPAVEPWGSNPSSIYALSLALALEENTNFSKNIGLYRGASESAQLNEPDVKSKSSGGLGLRDKASDSNNILRRYMGIGTVVYWGKDKPFEDPYPPLPIISYYYDSDDVYIDESGKHMVDNPTDEGIDSNEGVQTNYELFNKPAHISKIDGKVGTVKLPMISTEYTPKPAEVKVEYVDENNNVLDNVTIDADEVEETLKNLNENERLEYYRDTNEDSVYKLRGLILLNTTADYGIGEIAGETKYRGCIGLTANSDKAIFNLEDKDGKVLTT